MSTLETETTRVVSFLEQAAPLERRPAADYAGQLRFGVDLGTSTIVLTAIDQLDNPVYWSFRRERAVRDGVVVDFDGAVRAVRSLVAEAEGVLGQRVDAAATAFPPGVPHSECRACHYVLEQAGIDCRALVDEVSAAQALLRVSDGAIVDVGGGSTGVGVFSNGELVSLSDRPGGGHYLDLILAGSAGIALEVAEERKRTEGSLHLGVLAPGIERIAESIAQQCGHVSPGEVHLAGGALQLPGAAGVVSRYLGWPTAAYPHAELITPFGIAVS